MSRAVTSEEEILKVSCGIVAKKGIAAVNMRTVASECGIALGSLYNYFSSKSELLSATIEAVWKDIFQMGKTLEKCENIVEYLNLLFEGVENSRSRYPKFFYGRRKTRRKKGDGSIFSEVKKSNGTFFGK